MRNRLTLFAVILATLFMAGCPNPFTYNITKSTLDAGIREESVKEFQAATRTDERVVLKYSASVRVPGERIEEIESRWAVWETNDLRTKELPPVTIKSSPIEMDGDSLAIVPMSHNLLQTLEDYQRERFASVEREGLFWIGNGKANKITGLGTQTYRLFWGYLAQGSLPFAVITDILTYPYQYFAGLLACAISSGPSDPFCS